MTTKINNNRFTPKYSTPTSEADLIARLDAIDTALGNVDGTHRVGEVIIVCDTTVPAYALECDGSAVNRTTYADLYAILGDAYGNGDGSTTFNLPDYRGRMLRGTVPNGAAYTNDPDIDSRTDRADSLALANRYPGTTQDHARISHRHGVNRATNNTTGGGAFVITNSGSNVTTAASGGNEDRPRNVNVFFAIVYQGH